MIANLLAYLTHEKQLLAEMVHLSERQQQALIKFNITELEKITFRQVEVSKALKAAEEQRIRMMISILGISRLEASQMKLSDFENRLKGEEIFELKKMKLALKSLISKLQGFNMMNRVLANRARNSVREMLGLLTNASTTVCNVVI